jgi:hypothetical protein
MVRSLPLLAALSMLAACGGGGGGSTNGDTEKLVVVLDYSTTPIPLLTQTVVPARALGFEGRAPRCTFITGTLPPGMQLRSDCALVGRATQDGRFSFTVRVGAPGVGNTLDMPVSALVQGPNVSYLNRSFFNAVTPGQALSDAPQFINWTPPDDLPITWHYRITFGSLPSGLALDPATGVISGTVQETGAADVSIRPTLTSPFGSLEFFSNYSISSNRPRFGYPIMGGQTHHVAAIGRTFEASPILLDGGTLASVQLTSGSLPAGLVLDPASGRISGIPLAPAGRVLNELEGRLTRNGVTTTAPGSIEIQVIQPLTVQYPLGAMTVQVGSPVRVAPIVTQVLPSSPPGSYVVTANAASCNLPSGLSIDSLGVVTGTPSARGFSFDCFVEIALTDSGVTWTQGGFLSFIVE